MKQLLTIAALFLSLLLVNGQCQLTVTNAPCAGDSVEFSIAAGGNDTAKITLLSVDQISVVTAYVPLPIQPPYYFTFKMKIPDSAATYYINAALVENPSRCSFVGNNSTPYFSVQTCSAVGITDSNTVTGITAITPPSTASKEGIASVYDINGRLVKQCETAAMQQGLQPGTLYIYRTVYADNTFDSGKFVITE